MNNYSNASNRRIMALLNYRKSQADQSYTKYANYDDLAERTGLSQRQLRNIMKSLMAEGYVNVDVEAGRKTHFIATDKNYAEDKGYDHE